MAQRSALIVVGHIKRGSISYVPHRSQPSRGRSFEHHATLVITRVLKGHARAQQIPLIIHYGLTPVVGGHVKRASFTINLRGRRTNYPPHIIEIMDTGNSARSMRPLVRDAGVDNLWFLQKHSGIYGRKPGTGDYGIVDPEELQPLVLESYFVAYLSPTPERTIRKLVAANPSLTKRTRRHLDHLDVQRILGRASCRTRVRLLLPHYVRRAVWNSKNEVRQALVACGAHAGRALLAQFDKPRYQRLRTDILLIWRTLRYKPALPRLRRLLGHHNRYWATQRLTKGWWNRQVGSPQTRLRREIYSETYYAVAALRKLRDRRARRLLQQTCKRWRAIAFQNPQIVEECTAAIRELGP